MTDIWFHRYDKGRDVEGKFDYNSWIESEQGLKLAAKLDKNTILAEGYKELKTGRKYLALMGDWRNNKDEEVELDGIGGVNILVKAEVHRSGMRSPRESQEKAPANYSVQVSISPVTRSRIKLRRRVLQKWQKELDIEFGDYQTTSCGTLIRRRSPEMHNHGYTISISREILIFLRHTSRSGSDRYRRLWITSP